MATFYHVPSPAYREGDDLECWDNLQAWGVVTEADWKHEWADCYDAERGDYCEPVYVDTDVVSLFADRLLAVATLGSKGFDTSRIVRVDLPDDWTVIEVGEGWPAVFGSIPAQYLTVEHVEPTDELRAEAERAMLDAATARLA